MEHFKTGYLKFTKNKIPKSLNTFQVRGCPIENVLYFTCLLFIIS